MIPYGARVHAFEGWTEKHTTPGRARARKRARREGCRELWDQLALVDDGNDLDDHDYDDGSPTWSRDLGDCPPPVAECEGRPSAASTPLWLMFVLAVVPLFALAHRAAPHGQCRRLRGAARWAHETPCGRCQRIDTRVTGWRQRIERAGPCWRCAWHAERRRQPPLCRLALELHAWTAVELEETFCDGF